MSNTRVKTTLEWNKLNWRTIERRVYKLQKRIYKAALRGDVKVVRKLQKTLLNSWSAKCLAVRRVTQDNQGKKTAGVDGVKSLTPKQRLSLVGRLKLTGKAKPTRRVWIPKPGKEEKRPLGIPTIFDRALQALVKLAMEPEWEAKFEPNSYGFRPGRSCHDAIGQIYNVINKGHKYVLDADIAQCFDKINHDVLIKKIGTFPKLNRQIRAWLKSGVMDGDRLFPTIEGTPQGGVISPLLANIALHGLETLIIKAFPHKVHYKYGRENGKRTQTYLGYTPKAHVVRYADDFVILHENLEVILKCKEMIAEWLKELGLELKESKTRICHTLKELEDNNPGFDFLGFNIRQFDAGKYRTAHDRYGNELGIKTIITPSKGKVKEHYKAIAKIIDTHKAAPQEALISRLNPLIQGWANYYSGVASSDIFRDLDYWIFWKLVAWSHKRHDKSKQWTASKYWKTIEGSNKFACLQNGKVVAVLKQHKDTSIERHIKVKGNASPYDGNLKYWGSRMGKVPGVPKVVATLLKQQKNQCSYCGYYFWEEDVLEVHHKDRNRSNNKYSNLELLHRHCHDKSHASSANDNG
ncbi:group II intron reverse transcriptase/maturase [Planktothrix sp. FACHB-1365]|nr:group II intron reverse transcriptase/maturase [Planktothrix sp. FACHB-1365]